MGFEVGMTVYRPRRPHDPGLVVKVDESGYASVKWGTWSGGGSYTTTHRADQYGVHLLDMDKEIERRQSELRAWKLSRRAARRYK